MLICGASFCDDSKLVSFSFCTDIGFVREEKIIKKEKFKNTVLVS